MPLQIVRNDITRMKVDAIVNAANSSLLGGGGVDGCIHRAAGPKLLEECRKLGGCETGKAKMTNGYQLPCKYVIHTVGPIWAGGDCGEEELLTSCYRASLALALKAGCESIAFPLISAGVYGYPRVQALRVAVNAITEFLAKHEMDVYMVIFDKESLLDAHRFAEVQEYIDDHYVEEHAFPERSRRWMNQALGHVGGAPRAESKDAPDQASEKYAALYGAYPSSLEDAVKQLDESFTEMLLRKIDELGMTDAQCYKKANIDRKLFSKIRGDRLYRPSKNTALAFAIALELNLEETGELLRKAGFALSHSNKFDIIIEYFIQHGNYNIFEINEALFEFDQSLLGA